MVYEANPFVVMGKIEPLYFCGREDESARLVKSLTNGNNVVLISPRRMGKTRLIQHCYELPGIADRYYTFFVDILHTSSLREFTFLLGKAIYDTLLPNSSKLATAFLSALKSINGNFGFDPRTGYPSFNVGLGEITKPEYTIEEIFEYLEGAGKPCIVAIDEFQQVAEFPEQNIEALLRSHKQSSKNCNFIFAGSERHMLREMFLSSARPFYLSADIMELGVIDVDTYVDFVTGHFARRDRSIKKENVAKVYSLFKGHTYYMQKTFNEAFSDTAPGEECTLEMLRQAIDNILEMNASMYREALSDIPEKQKELLYAIAKDGSVTQPTSSAFIRRHALPSASSVQFSLKKLLERDIICLSDKAYSVTDRFFSLWIAALYGSCAYLL